MQILGEKGISTWKDQVAKSFSLMCYRSCDGTGSESKASPISTLLDTMGIADLCTKYYISLRQSLFMASLYLIIISNLIVLVLILALKKVSFPGSLDKSKVHKSQYGQSQFE